MRRTVSISTRGLSVRRENNRILIAEGEQVLARIPPQDLGLVSIEGSGVTISSGALASLAERGASLLVCDDHHLPLGLFAPCVGHSLHAERIRQQAEAPAPLKKRVWAQLVRTKIANQAALLQSSGARARLENLARSVRSGDAGNAEAHAASIYWKSVFPAGLPMEYPFRRRRDGEPPNDMLNYGYAVLRALVARCLVASGLHPGLGIHHRNRYSGYPLADDVMEPYRPWVDARVLDALHGGHECLTKESKKQLLLVLHSDVRQGGTVGPLEVAVERTAASLAAVFVRRASGASTVEAVGELVLPEWPAT